MVPVLVNVAATPPSSIASPTAAAIRPALANVPASRMVPLLVTSIAAPMLTDPARAQEAPVSTARVLNRPRLKPLSVPAVAAAASSSTLPVPVTATVPFNT